MVRLVGLVGLVKLVGLVRLVGLVVLVAFGLVGLLFFQPHDPPAARDET